MARFSQLKSSADASISLTSHQPQAGTTFKTASQTPSLPDALATASTTSLCPLHLHPSLYVGMDPESKIIYMEPVDVFCPMKKQAARIIGKGSQELELETNSSTSREIFPACNLGDIAIPTMNNLSPSSLICSCTSNVHTSLGNILDFMMNSPMVTERVSDVEVMHEHRYDPKHWETASKNGVEPPQVNMAFRLSRLNSNKASVRHKEERISKGNWNRSFDRI